MSPPDQDGTRSRQTASTGTLRQQGLLETRALEGAALIDAFVAAAEFISDADASCIALAGVGRLPLVTDDRKQRRIARKLFPELGLVSTLDLLHAAWIEQGWSARELAAIAYDLRWRGNFAPPRGDPRQEWYESLIEGLR